MTSNWRKPKKWAELGEPDKFALLCSLTADLTQALEAIELAGYHPEVEGDSGSRRLFMCIADSATMRYARAFSSCNLLDGIHSAKADAKMLTATFNEQEKKVHKMFMAMRN